MRKRTSCRMNHQYIMQNYVFYDGEIRYFCKHVSDFALFSRLLLISELTCCNCVKCWVFLEHEQLVFIFIVLSINVEGFPFCVCVDCN